MNIVVLAAIGLLVLVGLIAVGLGHRRWNWGTVAAAFLVVVSATTYLYLASRVAARDRSWMRVVRRYEGDIARVRDALAPKPRGGLEPIEGQQSLSALTAERDRWRRALDRVETWRSPGWENASFAPPKDAASAGQIDLPAEGNAEDAPPLQPGAHVFVFDMATLEDGGRYLGEFLVREVKYDAGTKRFVLTVAHASGRDKADDEALAGRHDAVAVYEDLPVDRWLAFYRTQQDAEATDSVMPAAVKTPLEEVEKTLKPDGEVGRLVGDFIESFKTHEEVVPEDEWPAVIASTEQGETLPGIFWGVVEFTAPHAFAAPEATDSPDEEDAAKREYEAGEQAELDMVTAVDLQKADKAKLLKIIRRRPLSDALARLHGSPVLPGAAGEPGIRADGVAGLTERLRAEVAELARADKQLATSLENVNAGVTQANDVAGQLGEDLTTWKRDAAEATRLTAAFEKQLEQVATARTGAERQVVELGRELTAIVARLSAEIDRLAPAPAGR
jgi:hypothetical protein